jgi:hypothetical protein
MYAWACRSSGQKFVDIHSFYAMKMIYIYYI